ncbi:hypothetical protein LX15_001887 [Streptoalloteichus tenebrarius]|uniref:XRE family transcriptional regulator n=1 Tax=Streptoalloteichus tenebrarius (strain ATCC 17920 / DSM 40477 / JCM 4838 / CBS 697.72 / NBRC 16177 / NCIMB 11028 / NRRL B-12390 / A12253. 1 / ISP 5477) TaxID=1933 RepID=A0ABT1HRP7_STRSD|nr:XRE family transcriptional regulator [Streptoalloteichus tenebrarius]MCP2258193.1 hypothetical protein [Streptoalloteichus tenebrarius]
MPDPVAAPDPRSAQSSEEYVAALRRLKDRSGLTYRQIERRAAEAGAALPRSTVASMLNRGSLPREELVVSLVTACGGSPDEVAEWVEARRRLASARNQRNQVDGMAEKRPEGAGGDRADTAPGSSAGDGPAQPIDATPTDAAPASRATVGDAGPVQSRRRTRPLVVLAIAVPLVVLAVAVPIVLTTLMTTEEKDDDQSPPGTHSSAATAEVTASIGLPAGPYRIRAAHSGLCLSERQGESSGQVHQAPCDIAMPRLSLELRSAGVYRIATQHPEFGPGCMGVAKGAREPGAVVADDYCGTGAAEEFRLEPVSTSGTGFRLRPVHSDLCLGVAEASDQEWAPVLQLPCEPTAQGQVFQFEPVR